MLELAHIQSQFCAPVFPTQDLMTSHWQLEISQGGSKNIMEIDKCYKPGFDLLLFWIKCESGRLKKKKSVHLLSFHSSFRKQLSKPFCQDIALNVSIKAFHLYLHLHFFIFFWLNYILYKMGNECLIQHFKFCLIFWVFSSRFLM